MRYAVCNRNRTFWDKFSCVRAVWYQSFGEAWYLEIQNRILLIL